MSGLEDTPEQRHVILTRNILVRYVARDRAASDQAPAHRAVDWFQLVSRNVCRGQDVRAGRRQFGATALREL